MTKVRLISKYFDVDVVLTYSNVFRSRVTQFQKFLLLSIVSSHKGVIKEKIDGLLKINCMCPSSKKQHLGLFKKTKSKWD